MSEIEKNSFNPRGELVLQTLAMPKSANVYGDIFGGWLVSQMDIGGSILAHMRARNKVTTVAIDSMVFLKPVSIGDCICCYAEVIKTGRSSIAINVEVWTISRTDGSHQQVTGGVFTFVAVDEWGKSKAIDWSLTKHITKL
ncbi:MAG: thioesterase superfamily protein [Francisellaceae bacterium]|nr:thioesterase superfamily protein [Francisellaceae bacterium]